MLSLSGVDVAYDGVPAVVDATLEVPDGAVLAVLGPSGCGKSTLLRAIAGLEPVRAGAIRWDGADLARVPTHRRGFALMFQDGQLFGHYTVARNVAYALRLQRERDIETRVAELLELVGLTGFDDRLPGTLSGGERQRVALARSLAARPRLLLLDEPLSALDAGLRERLAADLSHILREAGTTTLMVTHDQEEAFAVADRLAVMRAGRVVQTGDLASVWSRPGDPATALFLGYARVLTGEAAHRLLRAAGLPAAGAVALRRSALAVTDSVSRPVSQPGARDLDGVIVAARATPDEVRLVVRVEGVGEVDAVGTSAGLPAPGDRVRLHVDPGRLAPIRAPAAGVEHEPAPLD